MTLSVYRDLRIEKTLGYAWTTHAGLTGGEFDETTAIITALYSGDGAAASIDEQERLTGTQRPLECEYWTMETSVRPWEAKYRLLKGLVHYVIREFGEASAHVPGIQRSFLRGCYVTQNCRF